MNWKGIKIDNIEQIEKCVGEFEITALNFFERLFKGDTIHYGSFKVKIYENQNKFSNPYINANFTGYTNLRIKDSTGGYEGGIGFGATMEEALENTVRNFMNNFTEYNEQKKRGLLKEDLVLLSYDEF